MGFAIVVSLLSMALGATLSAPIWIWLAGLRRGDPLPRPEEKNVGEPKMDTQGDHDPLTLINREPRTLFVWRGGKDEDPEVLARGVADHPIDWQAFRASVATPHWEPFEQQVGAFRKSGIPFHVALSLTDGAYEAEGWTVNGDAFLSLRRACSSVTDLTPTEEMLERAPFPAWRRDASARLVWSNAAYARAVDLKDGAEAVRQQAALLEPETPRDKPAPVYRCHAIVAGERRLMDIMEFEVNGGWAGFAIDVTPIESAENARLRVAGAFRTVLDRVSTALAIFDAQQRLVFHNRAFDELWNLPDDFLSGDISEGELLDRLRNLRLIPEQSDYRLWRARRLHAYQDPAPGEEFWHLPDGRTLIAYTQAHPIGGVIRLYENVTEQLSLESSLRTQARVQQETIDNLHEAVAVFGADGRLKLCNGAYASLWGFDLAELQAGPHISTIIERTRPLLPFPERADQFARELSDMTVRRLPTSGQIHRRDGRILTYSVVPLPDGAILITSLDVTDTARVQETLRERNEALAAADQIKTDFIGHVSYQLRTPLTSILGFATMLARDADNRLDARQRDNLDGILLASQELKRMVDDMVDLAILDAGGAQFSHQPVNLTHLANEIMRRFSPTARSRKIDLSTSFEGTGSASIATDAGRVRQILTQLVSNALEHATQGDQIIIRLKARPASLAIMVEDTGSSLPPEERAYLFDRFEARAEPGRRRSAGLGLALVRGLVDGLGGFVTITPLLGQGTKITCHLPRVAA